MANMSSPLFVEVGHSVRFDAGWTVTILQGKLGYKTFFYKHIFMGRVKKQRAQLSLIPLFHIHLVFLTRFFIKKDSNAYQKYSICQNRDYE